MPPIRGISIKLQIFPSDMKEKDLYNITALVDGEIRNLAEEKKLREDIDKDPDLKFEYFIQSSVKNLIRERLKIMPAPVKVKRRLERKIVPRNLSNPILRLFPEIYLRKPMVAWGSTIVLLLALLLIYLNSTPIPEIRNYAEEQSGNTNMYIQAKHNFENILSGKLAPQFISHNPKKIREFFNKEGVKYQTYIPEIKDWSLVGAVVSVDHGEKFAHHVYSTHDGKLVYLFQVDESEINKKDFLTLTDDLISYLNSGNCYETTEGHLVTLLTRVKKNIFAVVSNGSPNEIETNLCQLK